ncbi:MAG: hypothetical protein GY765_17980 [bacterium]|nr:hypothetical protein [bacterium]
MVIIDNFFLHYKKPAQYIRAGEDYLDIYKVVGKALQKTGTINEASIFNMTSDKFGSVLRELGAQNTGLILNSSNFIFNIFDFEQIPLRESMRKEILEWRLKKVFPENLEDYEHNYFKINKTKILSVLFKIQLKEQIETLFGDFQHQLIYTGNSTINLIDNMGKDKNPPDFFFEIDGGLSMLVFLDRAIPFYTRKFRSGNEEDMVNEVVRTITYVKSSYAKVPRSYSVIAHHSELDVSKIHDGLAQQDLRNREIKESETMVFPG